MRKSGKKNKDLVSILIIGIFMLGLSIMLYPFISDFWNSRVQSKAVASYDNAVQELSDNTIDVLLSKAEEYNEKLNNVEEQFNDYIFLSDQYYKALDVSGTGIMGYVEISKIDVELPIYHGTSKGVLQIACGHLEGTSFPIGETGCHAVISAHRGLPSAKLFTDLDKLEEGDKFTITVLDKKMTYIIDQVEVVEPQQIDDLRIDPEKDYVTLMTCTPYGINSHRILVRGVRDTSKPPEKYVPPDAHEVNRTIVAISIALIMLAVILITTIVIKVVKLIKKYGKTKQVKDNEKENS